MIATSTSEIENSFMPASERTKEMGRFFIPMVSVYTKPLLLAATAAHSAWIGFNYFELLTSRHYPSANAKGLRDTFELRDKTKIFLSTTAKDEYLIRFYNECEGLRKFKSDVPNFGVDLAMGPDLFSYKSDPAWLRKELIEKSIELTEDCLNLENLVPTIRGTNFQEMASFIDCFKAQGKQVFVFAGREYLINLADRKRAQREVCSLTGTLANAEEIKLILTGCSSPQLQEKLFAVSGFAGQGWIIQSMQRRLIKEKTYMSIFDNRFSCDDPECCAGISLKYLNNKECDSVRAIHNLRKINAKLKNTPRIKQSFLKEV